MAKDVKKNTKAEIAAPKKTKKRKIVSLDKKKA